MPKTKVILRLFVEIEYKNEQEFWGLLQCAKNQLFSSNPYIKIRDTVTHDIPVMPVKD